MGGGGVEVIKALYGLFISRNMWHAQLSHTLREMGFKPTHFEPDVWIRGHEGGHNYIGTHTDDVLVVAANHRIRLERLKNLVESIGGTLRPVG